MSAKFLTAKLTDIAELNPPLGKKLPTEELVSFVPMASLSAESASVETTQDRPYAEVAKGFTPFLDGDVLVAKITPCFENGKIAQARLPRSHGFGSTEFHVVRARSGITESRYLHHYLRLEEVRANGQRRMTGSGGQRRVPASFLADLAVPLPPLEEQRRIAAILDQTETLRTQRRTALALLDSLTQSLFLDMFGDPVANPKGFSKQPLSVVAEITTGSTPGRGADGYYGGNIPWVKTTEVTGGEIHDTEEKLTEAGLKAIRGKLHPINSIVVAMYGQGQTRGRCALLCIEASCNQACGVIRPSEEFVPRFMFAQLLLAYERLRALGRGGNQENLNLQLLGSFEVLVPPEVLQQTFATRIASIEALKATHRRALAALDALFASLLQRAFAGQL